jgi:Dolichyl-phosphate-mannose-protein mannosyltransferase
MRPVARFLTTAVGVYLTLLLLHHSLLRLPYFWDEAGYYIPAALDFSRAGLLIPQSTWPTGHTPLVIVYLGLVWRVLGFSPIATRAAMIFVAASTVAVLYALGRRVERHEVAFWGASLLALSPLFFAQSSLAHLDLAVGLFTTLAVLALIDRRIKLFVVAASLAILSKETAVILLPVAWVFARRMRVRTRHNVPPRAGIALATPLLPLVAWSIYYHHRTGYWTGNPQYLEYNLYSTLDPVRISWSLLRRLYEVFIGGFNWVLVAGGILGALSARGTLLWLPPRVGTEAHPYDDNPNPIGDFRYLAIGLCSVYLLLFSFVGGAILPRYLLPIFPVFFLAAVGFVWRLPAPLARSVCIATAACFVWAWFANPPYPFPFEDNLAYADFIHLHKQAAGFLETQQGDPRILTAWPASDELARPFLGYVKKPLRVVPVRGFAERDFSEAFSDSFDILYLYSRQWEPPGDWLRRFAWLETTQERYFDYAPQISESPLVIRYGLKLIQSFERRGQWVHIYLAGRAPVPSQQPHN